MPRPAPPPPTAHPCVLPTPTLVHRDGWAWEFELCSGEGQLAVADATDEALRARGVHLERYRHRVYLLPPGPCMLVGMGYVGCDGSPESPCRVWVGGGFWDSPQVMAHELAHNLFLGHAGTMMGENGLFNEYSDSSCQMGYYQPHSRCFNTPHAWQLGWLALRQLDAATLAAGSTTTARLASQALSDRTGLQILAGTWASGADPVFVGYRTAQGGDVGLLPEYDGRVSVHTAAIYQGSDSEATILRAILEAGQAWADPSTGLVVRFLAKASNGTAADVSVCRSAGKETAASCAAGIDADCNGLAGWTNEPACKNLPKVSAVARRPERPAAQRRPARRRTARSG